jgi:endonuclease/exonuclease/phosphatase family metal-dependent hydrolase
MRVISWNLLHGSAPLLGAPKLALTAPFLALQAELAPDLIGLQEVDENQPRSGGTKQVAQIAEAMGSEHWAYARSVIGTPGEKWCKPKAHEAILHAHFDQPSYGIGLVSRTPVTSWHRVDLGRSWIGMPLLVGGKRGLRILYVKDEPRVALIAELANGYTVAVTHLSFVPIVNYLQLRKLQRTMKRLPGKRVIIGDLNLPFAIPHRLTRWHSLVPQSTYPAWKPAIQFDYIMSEELESGRAIVFPRSEMSDHLPIGFDFD